MAMASGDLSAKKRKDKNGMPLRSTNSPSIWLNVLHHKIWDIQNRKPWTVIAWLKFWLKWESRMRSSKRVSQSKSSNLYELGIPFSLYTWLKRYDSLHKLIAPRNMEILLILVPNHSPCSSTMLSVLTCYRTTSLPSFYAAFQSLFGQLLGLSITRALFRD